MVGLPFFAKKEQLIEWGHIGNFEEEYMDTFVFV